MEKKYKVHLDVQEQSSLCAAAGVRHPGGRPTALPVVPSDAGISAHGSMAAVLALSRDLYSI